MSARYGADPVGTVLASRERFSTRAREAYARQQEENARRVEEEAAQRVRALEARALNAFVAAVSTGDHQIDRGAFRLSKVDAGSEHGGDVVGRLDDITLRFDQRYYDSYTSRAVSVVLTCERCQEELLAPGDSIEQIGAALSAPPVHTVCPRDREANRPVEGPVLPVRRPMTAREEALIDGLVDVLSERGIVPRDDG